MIEFLKNFVFSLVAYLILDGIWLGFLMHDWYAKAFGSLARSIGGKWTPDYVGVVLAYLLMGIGLSLFVAMNVSEKTVWHALGYGAVFGLVTYGVYDFTNLATLSGWNWKIVLVDLSWGVFASAVASVAVFYANKLV